MLYILLVVQFISGYIRSHYHFGTSVAAPSGHIRATQMEMITALNRKQENKLNNHMLEWNSLKLFAEDEFLLFHVLHKSENECFCEGEK